MVKKYLWLNVERESSAASIFNDRIIRSSIFFIVI